MVFAKLESLGNCRKPNIDPKSHIETQLDSLAHYIHIGITFLIVDEPQRGKKLVTCRVRTLIPPESIFERATMTKMCCG